ncbi:MAG: PilZ domain-containing protein [Zetaproteobacteria bacterium CG12_big_fil_rev_8_21_14_0_65_54_13]|nr:MAG: PilZ domain-containing protein [Zetaproteobacteria bacterium CG23_combo_of_CG06-09_8_20_14_all_54_7]PIW48151.1 MAG: PilZ domain-containing protein [Zetaproteobacteria bacterium CG12_big_fil_rev_8_21_14_0_65_54_13]PIX55233.1 MAG: PilZ domain-containing protein [Zetaproteobacteria bacterium CG_4_10_14_3_um_filter_54_28]PJA28116.1 MAG: PilZ domain-containing protein [Zetaproteobacteria bacterium CG_4_9_14_3_um_filter_54_145]
MGHAETNIIEELTLLAERLPEERSRQLLDLISSWREDVRRSPRESYNELLGFVSSKGSQYGHARDISGTGVFIETLADFEIGDRITLELTFISAPNPVKLSGEVVRKEAYGVAVAFDQCSRDQVAKLDDIISKHALIMHPPRG